MAELRDIGVNPVWAEGEKITHAGEWDGDENCPFYGSLRLRGQIIEGNIAQVGMTKTVVVERQQTRHMPKYERYEKRTHRYLAHLPSCIGEVDVGDKVRIMECRPLSKKVNFCVIEMGGDTE
jgi:small subunit ribosomal protein S17